MSRRPVRGLFPRAVLVVACCPLLFAAAGQSHAQVTLLSSATYSHDTVSHAVTIRVPAYASLASGGIRRATPAGTAQRVLLRGNQSGLVVSTSTARHGLSLVAPADERTTLIASANQGAARLGPQRPHIGERAFEVLYGHPDDIPDDQRDDAPTSGPNGRVRIVYVTVTR